MSAVDLHKLGPIGRYSRGMTPLRPSRPLYGTCARCDCGQEFRSNEPPSKGGRQRVAAAHARHVNEARDVADGRYRLPREEGTTR